MSDNPLHALRDHGQSVWLDYIRRAILDNGTLATLIVNDGLGGLTSNPAIFKKAVIEHDDYDEAIGELARRENDPLAIYEELIVADIGRAADLFRETFEESRGEHGYVSIEVSPHLARDTVQTIKEARRLWSRLGRKNVLIKVPGTREGLPALRSLIAEGINVNVTLLFGLRRYSEVADAFMSGLEDRLKAGKEIRSVTSVASFFLSRIDVFVDQALNDCSDPLSQEIQGKAAIACAELAYQRFHEVTASNRWRRLGANGAQPQRLLWASTGTKNPRYSDVRYVEALVGPDTITTLPMETLEAFRDHGQVQHRLGDSEGEAKTVLDRLARLGIDMEDVSVKLEEEGIRKFVDPFDELLAGLESRKT